MKIVIIGTTSASLLGFRKDLILYLVKKKHDVFVLAIDLDAEAEKKLLSLGAVPIKYNFSRTGLNPISDINNTFKLSKIIKNISPEITLSYFSKPVIFGTIAAKLANVPRIIPMLEGLGYVHTKTKTGFNIKKKILQFIQGILYSISFHLANDIIFLNHDDPVDLSKSCYVPKDKINILGGIGLNLTEYKYSKPLIKKSIKFIFIGRLLKEKGIFEFIEACKIVKQKYPFSEFIVLGELDTNNPSSLSKEELDELMNSKFITYPGFVKNIHEWISSSHIFVLPSYREGFPRSTQEAMAIGRAIITTNVPGCRETVIDGYNGFIVPPFDSCQLSDRMIYFIESPQEIIRMGNNSYNFAKENFNKDYINPQITKIIIGKENLE